MKKIVNSYRYPCTNNIGINGFGQFLEQEIGEPRRNIRLFAMEFGKLLSEDNDDVAKHIVLVNSGSSANLVAALTMAEKCKKAGKPLTVAASAFTFPTTVSSFLLAGFTIKLIDVEQNGFNMSIDKLYQEKEPPSVVAITHFLGFPADMNALKKYQEATGCFILQDACETLNTHLGDTPLYLFGDIITWSFYHPHHLSSYGGGAIYSFANEDYVLIDSIAHWGRACKCHINEDLCTIPIGPAHQFTYENIGVNVEMSELNACFGRWQLRNWNEIEAKRQQNYQRLYDALSNHPHLQVWPFHNHRHDSPFVFPIFSKDKNVLEVFHVMAPLGIEIRTLLGGAICDQEAFRERLSHDGCPNARYMSEHTFFVGCHNTINVKDIDAVSSAIMRNI